jgi:hypothetical protein
MDGILSNKSLRKFKILVATEAVRVIEKYRSTEVPSKHTEDRHDADRVQTLTEYHDSVNKCITFDSIASKRGDKAVFEHL